LSSVTCVRALQGNDPQHSSSHLAAEEASVNLSLVDGYTDAERLRMQTVAQSSRTHMAEVTKLLATEDLQRSDVRTPHLGAARHTPLAPTPEHPMCKRVRPRSYACTWGGAECNCMRQRSYLPRSYLPRSYLPRSYFPRFYLPRFYLPRFYLPRSKSSDPAHLTPLAALGAARFACAQAASKMALRWRARRDTKRINDALETRESMAALVERSLIALQGEATATAGVDASRVVLEAWHRTREAAQAAGETSDGGGDGIAPAGNAEGEAEAAALVAGLAEKEVRQREDVESRSLVLASLQKLADAQRMREAEHAEVYQDRPPWLSLGVLHGSHAIAHSVPVSVPRSRVRCLHTPCSRCARRSTGTHAPLATR
jgi:hypothetical protein